MRKSVTYDLLNGSVCSVNKMAVTAHTAPVSLPATCWLYSHHKGDRNKSRESCGDGGHENRGGGPCLCKALPSHIHTLSHKHPPQVLLPAGEKGGNGVGDVFWIWWGSTRRLPTIPHCAGPRGDLSPGLSTSRQAAQSAAHLSKQRYAPPPPPPPPLQPPAATDNLSLTVTSEARFPLPRPATQQERIRSPPWTVLLICKVEFAHSAFR